MSKANHSYITHTVHYINEAWELCCYLLDTTEITTEHTAINLADELQESLTRWNLHEDKIVAVTTDNAWNIVNAIEILSWAVLPTRYSLELRKPCKCHK